ncbi:MAG: nicotinate-nucleotide adenylyltransferase [Desulfobacterales bacterium]
MRIGLFGGTFNPIHIGHITVSTEIKEAFELDRLYMIPSAIPPHKKSKEIADARDRLEMTRLAVSRLEGYHVSDIELQRSGPSYTVDTINHFKKILPADVSLYLILGIDAFLEIDTWMSYKELFKMLPFIVMSRPGKYNIVTSEHLESYVLNKVSESYAFQKEEKRFVDDRYQPIHVFNVTPCTISSTDIRKKIRKRNPIGGLVPGNVENYIKDKGLYL